MKLIDYGLLALVAVAVVLAVRHILGRRKRGCAGCCAACDQAFCGGCKREEMK